jgi:hypothetical protein
MTASEQSRYEFHPIQRFSLQRKTFLLILIPKQMSYLFSRQRDAVTALHLLSAEQLTLTLTFH